MVSRNAFINRLRELGYSYKDQTDKMQLWRRSRDAHMVWIRRKEDPLSAEYARQVLRQCGCSDAEIENFISTYTCH